MSQIEINGIKISSDKVEEIYLYRRLITEIISKIFFILGGLLFLFAGLVWISLVFGVPLFIIYHIGDMLGFSMSWDIFDGLDRFGFWGGIGIFIVNGILSLVAWGIASTFSQLADFFDLKYYQLVIYCRETNGYLTIHKFNDTFSRLNEYFEEINDEE